MSEKLRLYQLARELNVDSKDLLDLLKAAGTDVKNHMTALDPDTRQLAIDLATGKVKPQAVRSQGVALEAPPKPAPTTATVTQIPAPRTRRPTEIPKAKGAEKDAEPLAPSSDLEEPLAEVEGSAPAAEPPIEDSKPAKADASPPPIAQPVEESPAPPKVAAESPPAKKPISPPVKPIAPIPSPNVSKPVNLSPGSSGGGGGGGSGLPSRNRRLGRPRPIVAAPPSSLSRSTITPASKAKPEVAAQKPVAKLSPEAMRGEPPINPNDSAGLAPQKEGDRGGSEDDRPRRAGGGGGALAGREERQRRRGQRAAARRETGDDDDEQSPRSSSLRHRSRRSLAQARADRGPILLESPITVRAFSETAGIRLSELMSKLMGLNILASINATLSDEQAELLAMECGINVSIKKARDAETDFAEINDAADDDAPGIEPRPPIVTFMGHVDHGKTSLMDSIRKTKVAAGEAGGITQHIGAYQIKGDGDAKAITFLDTPGHEAFTAMRARGANVTDIVVLVIAADDGVMPQTEEAISHAKAANVSIIVAMNKSDLPQANPERLMQQLAKHELLPEAWGGDTPLVATSAVTGKGVDELLETILLVAELKELKANPNGPARGMCLEASLSDERGVQATLLVRNGTLRLGDSLVCGNAHGRVRAMYDDHGHPIKEAGPSTPVSITGLDVVPPAGERFVVTSDVAAARDIAAGRDDRMRALAKTDRQHVTLEKFFDSIQSKKTKELALIIKADVRGSLEAIKKEVSAFQHDEVRVKIIHEGIGAVSESDVLLADASDAIIVGFHVVADDRAQSLAADKGVEIRRYEIIYQVSDDIKKALEGLLTPESKEVQLGRAVVQKVFTISRVGSVAGCRVVQGTIERNAKLRVIRDGVIIGAYPIDTLRRVKDDVKDVREGLECGIKLAGFNDVKPDDLLEAFRIDEIRRTL